MAVLKCKMCGGDLEIQQGLTVGECEYCGSKQTVPSVDNEKKINLFMRANRLRSACEFDKASGVYESIITEFREEAEAYWGLVLCKYGIEYVDDPVTGKKIPTCHRSSFDNIMDDSDFELVMEYSDVASRAIYREEAKAMEELRKGIIEVSASEEPYDIFICYKESDNKGGRTLDSVIAQDIYEALEDEGYKVFYSRITLEDKLGQEYEPYIFAALNSAKVMIAIGTDYEYYNAVWVKNEWRRFLSLIEKGKKKTLIPCFKGLDAYDMPKEFARLQAQDLGKVGAIQDLIRGIGKIVERKNKTTQLPTVTALGGSGEALTQRGMMYLEDQEFSMASDYFDRALDINPTDSNAYLGKFLASIELSSLNDLDNIIADIENSRDYRRAMQFATPENLAKLQKIKYDNELKIERLRFLSVVRKHYNKVSLDLSEIIIKETTEKAYVLVAEGTEQGFNEAICLFEELKVNPIIQISNYAVSCVKANLKIQRQILLVMKTEHKKYTQKGLRGIPPLHRYSYTDIVSGLEILVKAGAVETIIDANESYYWIKDIEELRRRQQKECEEKQAAYEIECRRIDDVVRQEVEKYQSKIFDSYDSQIQTLCSEMQIKMAEADSSRAKLQDDRFKLKSQCALLGIFKMKEKSAIREQIAGIEKQLLLQTSSEQIKSFYQQRISKLEKEKQSELREHENAIRKKNPLSEI